MTTLAASYAPRRNTTSRRASVFGAAQTWPATVIGPRAASPLSTSRRSKRMVISLPRPALAHIPEKWTLISGLPDISSLKCANRKHPICVVFRKGYAPTYESGAHPDSIDAGCALVHELRRREQQRIPVLRRHRLVERRLGSAAEPLVKTREIEAVLQKRKGRQFCCIRLRWPEQAGGTGPELPRDFEPRHHLPRAVPRGRLHGVTVGRLVIEKPLRQPIEPVQHRSGIDDDLG